MAANIVSCLNNDSKIKTPNFDRLAAEGIHFTDAHSSSAVCTPSRYSLLTGAYPWRNPRAQILAGFCDLLPVIIGQAFAGKVDQFGQFGAVALAGVAQLH